MVFRSEVVGAVRTRGASGDLTTAEALTQLLEGTHLTYSYLDDNTVTITPAPGAGAQARSSEEHARSAQANPRAVAGFSAADPKMTTAGAESRQRSQLEEVVVTANKREQILQDVPSSITAETAAALQRRGAIQLQDIIDNTPGLTNPAGSGGGNSTNLTIRGVTTGADLGLKQATVALLFDDIPVDVAGQSGGATNLRVVDIQRVEVLRGPQGTLFGSGSLSGAVRYITNKPDLDQFSAAGEAAGASIQTGSASYWGNLTVNVPLIQDKLAVRAVAYRFRDGGWINDSRTGESDTNFTDAYGGRVAIAARPTEALSARLTVAYQDSRDNVPGVSSYNEPGGSSGQVYDGIYPIPADIHTALYNLFLQYDFDNVSLISSSTYQGRVARFAGSEYVFVPLTTGIATGFQNIVNGPDHSLYFVNEDNYTQELRLSSRGSGVLKWTVGGFYLHSGGHNGQQLRSSLVVPVIGSDNIVYIAFQQSQQELSAFGETTWTVADKWDLTVGARVSDLKVESDILTGGFIPTFSVSPTAYVSTHFREADSPVNPRASLAWRANPDLMVYVQAARGFRLGGINITSGVGGRDSPDHYDSDHLWNYEVGIKGKRFDGRLLYSAAAYYIDWKHMQVNLQNNIGLYTGNAGEAGLYGLELQVDSRPVDWLTVGAALSVSHNAITQGDPAISRPATGLVGVSDGDRLPASPETQASGYAQYAFSAMGHEAYLRLSARYLGREYTDFASRGTRFGDFAAADVRAGIKMNQWELVAFVNNLTNDQGKTGAVDLQTDGPVVISHQDAVRIRPRMLGLTARISF